MIRPKPKNDDGKQLATAKNCGNVLLFTEYKSKKIACFVSDGRLIKVFANGSGLPNGTLALAKVSEIKKNIGSAFLLLKDRQKCYIPLDELKPEYNLKRPGGEVKCGDDFLVKIKKEQAKGKLATATTRLTEEERLLPAGSRVDFSVLKYGPDYVEEALVYADERNVERIITDDPVLFERLTGQMTEFSYKKDVLHLYKDALVGLNVLYSLSGKIEDALNKKVWLKSGAYILIEPTEAMTVIDVNSGKKDGTRHSETDFLSINKEAGEEILHQMVLRNLSGMILIDFINCKDPSEKEELLEFIKKKAGELDKKIHVVDFTALGIMETTRQKSGKTLYEEFNR